MKHNRRFCTVPDLSSPREHKNTDKIDDTFIIYDNSPTFSDSGDSTTYLFQRVQRSNRRRYRVLLSLVSTMTLIATAVAIISVTVKKMTSSGKGNQNKDDSLWYDENTLAPGEEEPVDESSGSDIGNNNIDDGKELLFPLPPIFASIDVTAPPALVPRPAPTTNPDNENNGPLFGFPPIASSQLSPSAAPSVTYYEEPEYLPTNNGENSEESLKRPSYLDLTPAPLPPTTIPTATPTQTPSIAPTVKTIKPTKPPPMPTIVLVPDSTPSHAPFSPFLDIIRPVTLETNPPGEEVIVNDDFFGFFGKSSQVPTPKPTRKPRRTKRPTEAPIETLVDQEDLIETMSPTWSPTDALVTKTEDEEETTDTTTSAPTWSPSDAPVETFDDEVTDTTSPTWSPTWSPTDTPVAAPQEDDDQEEVTSTPSLTEEPTMEPTETPSTMRPKRTRPPSFSPVTLVPTAQAPVTSTLAPTITTSEPSAEPTTLEPSAEPTTLEPSAEPTTLGPSAEPTTLEPTSSSPTASPPTTKSPTFNPTLSTPQPIFDEVTVSTDSPVPPQEEIVGEITYRPGELTQLQAGLRLSAGLKARIIATAGQPVVYANGQTSEKGFHGRPDAGQTFSDTRQNPGGWVYVSNSEMRHEDPPGGSGNGGVGAITFDKDGSILNYGMILENSDWNCGGGRSPWNTWISCEEAPKGVIWQTDPMGYREPEILTMGKEGGSWESFTYDIRDLSAPHFFVTEDAAKGALLRYTPSEVNWEQPWGMLHGDGTTEYLELTPNDENGGTYQWVSDRETGRENARLYYPNCEGIDSNGESIFFVSKLLKQMFELNLNDYTYTNVSTVRGLFDGKPDQIARILRNGSGENHEDDILYFTEEGGVDAGVHGRSSDGRFFTILEGPEYKDETSGLAFSPNGKFMYIAFQENGVLLEVSRADGHPFHAKSLNVKYHATS